MKSRLKFVTLVAQKATNKISKVMETFFGSKTVEAMVATEVTKWDTTEVTAAITTLTGKESSAKSQQSMHKVHKRGQ